MSQREHNKIKNESLQPVAYAKVVDYELEKVIRHGLGE